MSNAHPKRRPCGWALALTLAAGCSSNNLSAAGDSTGELTSLSSSSTGRTSSATSSTSSSIGDDDTTGRGFITDPDGGDASIECSISEQDCPRGHKCNAWSNNGGNALNATKCVPLPPAPDAVGEPCTVEPSGGLSGLDSCDAGSICWDYSFRTGEGTCIPYCVGSAPMPTCEDPDRYCLVGGNGVDVLALCFIQCSPLHPDTCDAGLGCYPSSFSNDDSFRCGFDESEGGGDTFEPCSTFNDCVPGLRCTDAAALGGHCGADAESCCTPFCDISNAACPEGTECVPTFPDGAPPMHQDLGSCLPPSP